MHDLVNPITAKRTSDVPINGFTDNDTLFLGAFPHLFLFGRGFPAKGSSSPELHAHYLHQFTGTFAKSNHFVFALSNQLRRHACIRSVHTRVKNTPEAFKRFSEIVNSIEFKERTWKAVDDPLGPDAKYVIQVTEPYIQMCGKHVPYSPMERDSTMGQMCAVTQRYGTPSIFLTIAPDDTHNPLILRAAFPSKTNQGFPADPGQFLETLRRGDVQYDEHAISEYSLQQIISENPVAGTVIFKKIMENLFDILLGIPVVYKTKKTVPLSARSQRVFQKSSSHPSIVKRIAKVLDTMLVAMILKEQHPESMIDRIESVKRPRLIYSQSPRTTLSTSDGESVLNPDYKKRVCDVINYVQIHSHL